MQFTFDSQQPHQRVALDAVIDLFGGHFPVVPTMVAESAPGQMSVMAVPNRLTLSNAALMKNLRRVQKRSPVLLAPGRMDSKLAEIVVPFSDNPDNGLLAGREARFPNFSLEMETGTGKTYLYLRTIRELAKRFGFLKFIVVVPSIAVREGVLHAMRSTDSHLTGLCGIPCVGVRYDSARLSGVGAFARATLPQAMVMTIDSFLRKETLLRRSSEGLIGETPLHFIQACRPILILDEPQNMESDKAVKALARLNPLFALRYSATHRKSYNMIHRLTPMEAYRSGLVKRLEIDSVEGGDTNAAYFRILSVNLDGPVRSARVEANTGTGRRRFTMRRLHTLEDKTGMPHYRGFQLTDIVSEPPRVEFSGSAGHVVLKEGEAHGETDKEEMFRAQISAAIQDHFTRQQRLRGRGIKVLSLFFIDKVANYRGEGEGDNAPMIRRIFEEEFDRQKQGEWKKVPAAAVHKGYFAKSQGGNSEEDARAYQLIMRDKESLLTFPNPKTDDAETLAKRRVAFIFTHSALREGWDNPNIFQICALNETASEMRKRQEIGRGLRLAVDQSGNRVLDNSVNILTVIPNRNYEAYVSEYQGEIEEDYAAIVRGRLGGNRGLWSPEQREFAESYKQEFAPLPPKAKQNRAQADKRHIRAGKGGAMEFSPAFKKLWGRIQQRTEYIVNIDSKALVKRTGEILSGMRIPGMEIVRAGAVVEVNDAGDFVAHAAGGTSTPVKYRGPLPDVVRVVNRSLESGHPPLRLSRPTICGIVRADVERAANNPFGWSQCAADAIRRALAETLRNGVVYEKKMRDGQYKWRTGFEREFPFVSQHIARVRGDAENAAYRVFPCDSELEVNFANDLARRRDVKLFLKLPRWFVVATPMGDYNPDWAILFADGRGGEKLVLIAETKGRVDNCGNIMENKITPDELAKIHCAAAHFGSKQLNKKGALDGTDFLSLKDAKQLPLQSE